MLNIVVCIKQVPMVTELPWDEKTGTLRRDLAAGMMNPACKRAVEAALQIKEKQHASLTVITMGPPVAEEVLREALAMGADRGILICDPMLKGSDTYATSFVLAEAIKKESPDCDLILCGAYTSDSETAQVGPQLAEELSVPAAAYVENLDISVVRCAFAAWWIISVRRWKWTVRRWSRFPWNDMSRVMRLSPA